MLKTLLAVPLLAACVTTQEPRLLGIIERPLEHDGQVIQITIYPYDLFGADNRYIMCFSPCDRAEAEERQLVIYTETPGAFSGMSGQEAVSITARFSAACFQPESVCLAHRPYVFHEVQAR